MSETESPVLAYFLVKDGDETPIEMQQMRFRSTVLHLHFNAQFFKDRRAETLRQKAMDLCDDEPIRDLVFQTEDGKFEFSYDEFCEFLRQHPTAKMKSCS